MSDFAPEPGPDETAGPLDEAPEAVDEATPDSAPDAAEMGQEFADPVRTGVEEVDAVLDSVADLEGRPVDEHVATFESAHERLRGALDSSSGDSPAG